MPARPVRLALGMLMRSAREKVGGLSQQELAERVPGATQSNVSKFERGTALPSTRHLAEFAKAMQLSEKLMRTGRL